jgi:hypothetical protein
MLTDGQTDVRDEELLVFATMVVQALTVSLTVMADGKTLICEEYELYTWNFLRQLIINMHSEWKILRDLTFSVSETVLIYVVICD